MIHVEGRLEGGGMGLPYHKALLDECNELLSITLSRSVAKGHSNRPSGSTIYNVYRVTTDVTSLQRSRENRDGMYCGVQLSNIPTLHQFSA